ncbi:RND transporter, partial [Herbaspirillum sp. HC18]
MRLALVSVLVGFLVAGPPALAHEGHDHGAPTPVVGTSAAPRAQAASTDLELVAVARGGELEIALDHFADNAPVTDASIEIDTPSGLLKPVHRGHGLYVVS